MLFGTSSGGGVNSFVSLAAQIPLGEWHHHLLLPDRTTGNGLANWYIDGALVNFVHTGSVIATNTNYVASGNLNLGARNGGSSAFTSMEIAGLHLWNRPLAIWEIAAVYRSGWGMFQPLRRSVAYVNAASGGSISASQWFLTH